MFPNVDVAIETLPWHSMSKPDILVSLQIRLTGGLKWKYGAQLNRTLFLKLGWDETGLAN